MLRQRALRWRLSRPSHAEKYSSAEFASPVALGHDLGFRLTALKHINVLAQCAGVQVNPHIWGTAIGQYASLHMIAATPTTNYALFADQPLFEYDTSSHPFRTALVDKPLNHQAGWLPVPDDPGLGFDVDTGFLSKHAVCAGGALV